MCHDWLNDSGHSLITFLELSLATRSNSKSSEDVLQITRARVVENSDKKTEIDLEIKLKNWSVLENIQWKSFFFFTFVCPYANK